MKAIILTPEELEDVIKRGATVALNSFLASHPDKKTQPVKVQPEDSLLTVKDLQELLKVSRVTINSWVKSGYLQKKCIGRRAYFSRAQVLSMESKKGGRS